MAHLLLPFDALSLRLAARAPAGQRAVYLPLVASSPSTSPGPTTRPRQPLAHRHDSLTQTGGWHHGGIND